MQYRRSGSAVYAVALLALAFIWPFGGGTKVQLSVSSTVPGANAFATIGHDRNQNTTVHLDAKFLPPPQSLSPAQSVYVVWIQADGRPAQNKGQLMVNGSHEGQINIRTPYRDFEIFVTAQPSALSNTPEGPRVIFGRITRQ